MLTKRRSGIAGRGSHQALAAGLTAPTLDRRGFLRKSGLAAGGLAALGSLRLGAVRRLRPPAPRPIRHRP